jgi:hypothetical protein
MRVHASGDPGATLLVGIDANTHNVASKKTLWLDDFAKAVASKGLSSCWGPNLGAMGHTTFNARTYLQPQLNKAGGLVTKKRGREEGSEGREARGQGQGLARAVAEGEEVLSNGSR